MPINRFDIAPLLPALESGAVILVPNNRIRDAVLAAYAAASTQRVFRTPAVFAIDIWIQETWEFNANRGLSPFAELTILGATEELFIWLSIVEKSLKQIPLLNPEETAASVSQSYRQLKQWLLDDPQLLEMEPYSGIPDVAAFRDWIMQYQDFCQQQQCQSLVDATIGLIAELGADSALRLPQEILLLNFHQPPPLYRQLFDALAQLTSVQSLLTNSSNTSKQQLRYQFSDLHSETLACAHWASQLMQQDPDAHIGVIINHEQIDQLQLERAFREAIWPASLLSLSQQAPLFNSVNSGRRLLDSALIYDALLLLGLCVEQQDSSEFCRLLQSPHVIAAADEQESRAQMILFMHRFLSARCSLTELSWHLSKADKPYHCPQLGTALLKVRTRFRNTPASMNTAAWAIFIADVLTDFGWPGESQTASEQRVLEQWQELLNTFANASTVVGSVGFSAMLARLRMLCNRSQLRSSFNHQGQLSLFSIDEAIGLQFDHVWLLGFDDTHWPPATSPSPFIPYALQKQLEIPGCHSESVFRMASANFDLLCGSTTASIIASHHENDEEQQLRASNFSLRFPLQVTNEMESSRLNGYALNLLGSQKLERSDDLEYLPLADGEQVKGGQSIISNQSSCPFRAFALHRLHADPLPDFESGLDSMTRGTAIHIALEHLYASIDSSAELQALNEEARMELAAGAADQAIEFLGQRHQQLMTPRFRELERTRIRSLLLGFLTLESSRPEFRVIAREQPQRWQQDRLVLNLKIDRIDQLDDGSLALIDYKTGKSGVNRNLLMEDRPENMQLPLYYTVAQANHQQPVSAVNIAHVNVEKTAYSGIAAADNFHASVKPCDDEKKPGISWQDLGQGWQRQVELLATEFIDGKAQVAPTKGSYTCQYCGLESLCRIRELSEAMIEQRELREELTEAQRTGDGGDS